MPGAFPSAPSAPQGDVPVPKAVTVKSMKEKQKEEEKRKAKESWDKAKKKAGEVWEGVKKIGGNLMEGVKGMFAPKQEVIVSSHSHLVEGAAASVGGVSSGDSPTSLSSSGGPSIVKPSKSTEKIKSLESYASYEEGGQEGKIIVQVPLPVPVPTPSPGAEAQGVGGGIGGGSKAPSPFMALYRGDG